MKTIALVLALVSSPAALANRGPRPDATRPSDSAASEKPLGFFRSFVARHQLAKAGREIDRLRHSVDAWTSEGKPDALKTHTITNDSLDLVVEHAHEVGRVLSHHDDLIHAYNAVPRSVQAEFELKIETLRESLRELSGVSFIGGGMNSLFSASSDVSHKAGLAGINHFLQSTTKSPMRAEIRRIGFVENQVTFFGFLPKTSPAYVLRLD